MHYQGFLIFNFVGLVNSRALWEKNKTERNLLISNGVFAARRSASMRRCRLR